MALPDELSAANIAILVSKSAAEARKLAYAALFRIHRFCNSSRAPDVKYPEMQHYKIVGRKSEEIQ